MMGNDIEIVQFTEDNAVQMQAFIADAGVANNGPSYVQIGERYGAPGDLIIRGEVDGVVRFSIQHQGMMGHA